MEPIIEVKNISKQYKISHQRGGYISLRDVIMTIIKSPFSFLKQKAKSVAGLAKKEDFWALKGVDFTVNKGEVIGVIGHNGAGKSTLLKILSQITPPTEGEIIMRGTVGSLLEVGTGFHPELTGRENIFLNGAILGMPRKEIAAKFDQIVDFAGIEKFLDTPVKYYSSGMYVRLAFSVAAHMEPDILLVDEVLAVGDAEFQKKCLGKMEEVTHKDGRTIIFVSHNLAAIQKLCKKCILLEKGKVVAAGPTNTILDLYSQSRDEVKRTYDITPPKDRQDSRGYASLIHIEDVSGTAVDSIPIGIPWRVRVQFSIKEPLQSFVIAMSLKTTNGTVIRTTWSKAQDISPGEYDAVFSDDSIQMNAGIYTCNFGLSSFKQAFHYVEDAASIKVTEEGAVIDHDRILTVAGAEIFVNPMNIDITKRK